MLVNKIEIHNFRNYENLECEFGKGINFIVGENAKGKTNLVEAIATLNSARSFRTSEASEMIKEGANELKIHAKITNGPKTKLIDIEINKKGKKVRINNEVCKRISDLNSLLKVYTFTPKDTLLLKGAPKDRRNYLNQIISQNSPTYLRNLIQYEKLLKERNDALKEFKVNKVLIEILKNQLISLSWVIFNERADFIAKLNKILEKLYPEISLTKEVLKVKYLPIYDFADKEEYINNLKKEFDEVEDEELLKKTTLIGVHKEDFTVYLGQKNIAKYGSQGENRMAVLVLKLAPYFIRDEIDNPGIVILDDVLSELDKNHEENLLNYLEKMNQVFITNTEKSEFYRKNYYIVEENKIHQED